MPIEFSKYEDQARSYFAGGTVKERKAVSFESPIKGSSTLYSISTFGSDEGGTVEEHVHKGFEVLTYVLAGQVDHQESGAGNWIPLEAGDFQVIRAASGMTHSERYAPGTQAVQICMDPDFRRSLQRPASFTNYEPDDFEPDTFAGMQRIDFNGDESPVYLTTKLGLARLDFEAGQFQIPVDKQEVLSVVVLEGAVEIEGEQLGGGDLVQVTNETEFSFSASEKGALLTLTHALEPGYRTYNDQLQVSQ